MLNGSCAQPTAQFGCLLYLIFFKSGGQIVSSFPSLQACCSQGSFTSLNSPGMNVGNWTEMCWKEISAWTPQDSGGVCSCCLETQFTLQRVQVSTAGTLFHPIIFYSNTQCLESEKGTDPTPTNIWKFTALHLSKFPGAKRKALGAKLNLCSALKWLCPLGHICISVITLSSEPGRNGHRCSWAW